MRLSKILSGLLFMAGIPMAAQAQRPCPTISGLPDTIRVCKNVGNYPLPTPSISNIVAGTVFFDSAYYNGSIVPGPGSNNNGLSNPGLNNPPNTLAQSLTNISNISRLVNIRVRTIDTNIIVNGNFSQATGTTGFTTDYTRTPLNATFPGSYDIVTNSTDANPTFLPFTDNTTGTGGMMVVNGSNVTPFQAVYCTTIPAQPGKDYRIRFSSRAATGLNLAQLIVRVNGTNITPSPGFFTPPPGTWNETVLFYSNFSATSLTICFYDINTAVNGNDFALDDIIAEPMCVLRDSTWVDVTDLRPLIQNVITFGCENDTVQFKADTVSLGGPPASIPTSYFWQFGDGGTSTDKDPLHIYQNQGVYTIRLKVFRDIMDITGAVVTCSDSTFAQIDTRHPFNAGFTQDKIRICQGDEVSFTDTSSPAVGLIVTYYSGAGDTSILESPKFTYPDAGVFTVTQIVTDNLGCSDTATSQVISIGTPVGSFTLTDTALCEGQSLIARAAIDSTFEDRLWDFGDGRLVADTLSVRHSYTDEGSYTIRFTATHPVCPGISLERPVSVSSSPRVNLGADTSICPTGQPIYLFSNIATNNPNTSYRWENGDSSSTRLIRHHGTYYLTAFNDLGCSAVDTIVVAKDCYLDIPNVFTPGSEGSNAYFLPRQNLSKGLQTFSMKVYNRWGQQVYETFTLDGRGWDGRFNGDDQPMGVYIYRIEASFANGATEKYEGNVTLLR